MRLVVRFTIETLTPLLRTQPFKPSLAKAMAWAGSMKPKIVVMTRKKDSATTDGMSSVRLPAISDRSSGERATPWGFLPTAIVDDDRAGRKVTTAIVSLACQFQF